MKQITADNAAQIIGVSSATIRNWAKARYITPASTYPLSFWEESVLTLKEQISSNVLGERLTTRANKAASMYNFFPEEYATNTALISHISKITEYIKEENLEIELIMFLATLQLLASRGEVVLSRSENELFDLNNCTSWRRQSVKEVMFGWRASVAVGKSTKNYSRLSELLFLQEEDYLGLLYQSIASEGCKSKQGSYFTPTKLVIDALAHINIPVKTFLDPCCGTGKFLIHAASMFSLDPEHILGFDIDHIAIYIAKINLLLMYREQEFVPRIHHMDSLSELATGEIFCETNSLLGSIDVIATNPPWGAYKNTAAKGKLSKSIKSGETFSLFLEKSIRLLRNGGQLSFILPESILKIRTHSDIRALLLKETAIATISLLGKQFTGVYTPVIRLDVVKQQASKQWMVTVEHAGNSHNVLQDRFNRNEHVSFDIQINSHEENLLKRIYSVEHLTLAGHAEWALGIVTGDNKKHVYDDFSVPGTEPILRGSDIYAFGLGEPTSYICFVPERYQQVASEKYYRAAEKLLYKFISKKLVFAYDDRQRLSLNSANILIPSIPEMSMKVVLAFLNSKVFQYIFIKTFATHKVLRGDLEKLPFPRISRDTHNAIEHLVDVAIASRRAPEALEHLVFETFNLNTEDSIFISNVLKE